MAINANQMVTAHQTNFQTLGLVLHKGSVGTEEYDKLYTYKAIIGMPFEKGDKVIVKDSRGYYRVVTVGEVHDTPQIEYGSEIEYTWIVQKVDPTHYNNMIELEAELYKKLGRLELQAKRKEYVKMAEETSPEVTKLLANL